MRSTEDLEALVREQADQLQRLTEEVGDLRRRLDAVGAVDEPPAPAAAVHPTVPDGARAPGDVEEPERTGRRDLLRRAGAVAAGAAAGGAAAVLGTAIPAAAAQGAFDGNPAVSATSSGTAVQATSSAGIAVYADAPGTNGLGVYALGRGAGVTGVGTSGGTGVVGSTFTGTAVEAEINDPAAKAHLLLSSTVANVPSPLDRSDAHQVGEIVLDRYQMLWMCVAAGSPGFWRRLGGFQSIGAITLLTSPVRVYDSRPGNPPLIGVKAPLGGGNSRVVDCTANSSGVPLNAAAVLVNLTVVNTSASGFLAAAAAGVPVAVTFSSINWSSTGTIVANTTIVRCSSASQISCYVPSGSSTDFFVDVIGYAR